MGELKGIAELERASAGSIVPIYEEIGSHQDTLEFFMKISDYGRKKNSILLESVDVVTKYGEKSIGSANPCLKVRGKGKKFEINTPNYY